ncbi:MULTISPECIES: AraC family transcriptional regulator [unclassified Paenibacillus]|uniref:helix-turn-helix transcriptional regulator n=1 Tax=unclassified Paenibacillus TaxID=185978 RepID=UPI002405800E|nr:MULTISPECIES: AraC family transcriptional regulator [unclassified Paenibacillus]MDF9843389.1 two-component system response regulator YesN [Paenibacillus sp. PastF-2]MDF9849977.1 two-component system response regulator YesN [Paenibacillus sp. PastM-2]MDF9856685.1 two-component system response regulator YesN [Paenibacillus sp. PastF-1]MDH6481955.1 two-component system response regulator YesN [Paenibacillus sp. PastH-2]MDH6509380.1 two-component system response regulator YesN [Paenibacillus sp
MDQPNGKMVIPSYLSTRSEDLNKGFVHPPLDYEHELLEAIRLGSEDKAMEALHKINALEAATLACYPLRSKKNALIASCTLFTRAIIRGGVDPETAFQLSDTLIREIEVIGEIGVLLRFEYEMVLQFIAVMKREKEVLHYSHIVNLSVYFIREHIYQDLTLALIAGHVGVHPSYLSDRFKQETGMPLTEFINRRKIEESKPILMHSNQSISGIAFMFKFCSQSYYTQLFKKYTGMTPRQFRRDGATTTN